MRLLKKIKEFPWGYPLLALLLSGLGLCFFAGRPNGAEEEGVLNAMAIAIGVLTVLYAAVFAFFTLTGRRRGLFFALKLVFAAAVFVAGILALIARDGTVAVILNVMGLLLIVDGSFKLNTAILTRQDVSRFWWLMLALSFLLIGGGFVLLLSLGGLSGLREGSVPDKDWQYIALALLLFTEAFANFLTPFFLSTQGRHMYARIREEVLAEEKRGERKNTDGPTAESGGLPVPTEPRE